MRHFYETRTVTNKEETLKEGWEALDDALVQLHGDAECMQWVTAISYAMGGDDPLDQIRAFLVKDDKSEYWHYVSYGFSELFGKEGEDPDVSGYGFELTCRVKTDRGGEAPKWPALLMQRLAQYVFDSGAVFEAGEWMDLDGPIDEQRDTKLVALVCDRDKHLPSLKTVTGRVEFIEIVGITSKERDFAESNGGESLLVKLRKVNSELITDLKRDSYL